MAGEWWDFGDFNLGGGGGGFDFGDWWNPSDFNLDFTIPDFNFNWDLPNFDFGFDPSQFNLGFDPSFFNFSMQDPLALPSFGGGGGGASDILGSLGQAFQPQQQADAPMFASRFVSPADTMSDSSDPMVQMMAQYGGPTPGGTPYSPLDATSFPGEPFAGLDDMGLGQSTVGGSAYAQPFDSSLNTGLGPETAGGQPGATGQPSLQDLQRQVLQGQIGKMNEKPGTMDTITKLLAAFGPTAIGAAGLGMQAANRPERNPLEDDLLRARIASSGTQDALAKDRLAFEKENAMRMAELQAGMQEAMLESRKPGGQANINALLQGNPQLAALYNALTKQTTGLADSGGSPEFNALIDQIAQVDIAELNEQAQQQIDQAMEMQARQGINPANIIAKIKQTLMQESAKARANARATLIQQLQPGISTFNSIGSLFGNLFQTPSA